MKGCSSWGRNFHQYLAYTYGYPVPNARILLPTVFLLITSITSTSQVTLSGRVVGPDGDGVPGATVRLSSAADTTIVLGAVANSKGVFEVRQVPSGPWRVRVSMLGFAPYTMTTFVRSSDVQLGDLKLSPDTVGLRSVEVQADAIAAEMKGDTAQFNAQAFKTNQFASSEELVKKMPGITIEDGTVKAQGETVQRVLVDGRRFFGDDARSTLQNVPADMVQNVQVYDARTNISMFSGFDDGNTEKTINLITKKDKRKGAFGNVYGGYGTDQRFSGGATFNSFDGDQRITLLGLTNNINQQNFSVQDVLGSMGITGGQARMMSNMANRMGPSAMFSRGGSSASNLFVGQQGGITTTHALGTQYSDTWGGNTEVSASYFFNYADNTNNSNLDREYVQPAGQSYTEDNLSNTINQNHRFNMRLESTLDSMNRVLFEPRLSYQNRTALTDLIGTTTNTGQPLSSTRTSTTNEPVALTLGGELDYSHRFNDEGRTFAVELGADWRTSTADGGLTSLNSFTMPDTSTSLDQISFQDQDGLTLNAELTWTEPFGKAGMVRLQYEPSVTFNDADKQTFAFDSVTGNHSQLLPLLTNTYDNQYTVHSVEAMYRVQFSNTIITAGTAYQVAQLSGNVTFPATDVISRSFYNWIPNVQIRQRFSQQSELTFRYRLRTDPPSVSQLQNVVDNSNPLQLSIGNPQLDQSLTHDLSIRFRDVDWMAGRTLFGFVSANFLEDYVATRTVVTATDTIVNGILLPAGGTITSPENLDGYVRINSFFTYGFRPGTSIVNLNLNGGVNYTRTPSTVNGAENFSNNTSVRGGLYASSNVSEDLDISIGYDANYNIIINSLTREQDANYFSHTATGRLIWNIGPIACSTDVAHTMFTGLGDGFDQTYTVWNAGIGWRMLNNAGELRLSVFDLLKQNASIGRTVNPVSIDNTQTQVLTRYAMVTFSYQLRAFDQANMPSPTRPPFRRD